MPETGHAPHPHRRDAPGALPPRVTLPLLTLITQQSLDEDYLHAAERRAAAPLPDDAGPDDVPPDHGEPGRGLGRGTVAVVVGFGLLVSVAFVQNSRQSDVDSASRTTLIERIDAQRARVDGIQQDLVDLRESNADLQSLLTRSAEDEQAVESRLRRLQVQTGFVPVRGEGVRVVVENDPGADPVQRVSDLDLTLLVNGLWTAGAEAVSVNGQRLTALSAIRTSGDPIEVNSVGVASPYTVLAVGDSAGLQASFFDTSSGLAFDALSRRYAFTYEIQGDDGLSLPAGPARFLRLRFAEVPGNGDDALPQQRVEGEETS